MTRCLTEYYPFLGVFLFVAGNNSMTSCILDGLLYVLQVIWILQMAAYILCRHSLYGYGEAINYNTCTM